MSLTVNSLAKNSKMFSVTKKKGNKKSQKKCFWQINPQDNRDFIYFPLEKGTRFYSFHQCLCPFFLQNSSFLENRNCLIARKKALFYPMKGIYTFP